MPKDSDTETFAAVRVEVDNWRWAGVPFYLRTGKCLAESRHLVALDFREPPMNMFPGEVQHQGANQLVFEFSEPGSITADFQAKVPGPTLELGPARMTFRYDESFAAENQLEAYERLIHDAMIGDSTLFTTADGIERLWEVSAPALDNPNPVIPYEQGTWGPKQADELLAPFEWRLPEAAPERRTRTMAATKELHDAGQSLWLDNITRDSVTDGTIKRYIDELSLTGLTSNPTIFDKALAEGDAYDEQTSELLAAGKSGEELFFELAIRDLQGSCDLFAETHRRTDGVDGWSSLEVSPLLARDTAATAASAAALHKEADRDNLFIKIPGTPEGLQAIEDTIDERHAGQRHPALRRRPVRRPGRGLHARDRAPDRRGARPEHRLGRLAVRQPLGRRRLRQGSGRAREPARHGRRDPRLRRLPRADRERPLAAARERGRPSAALPLRLDRDQGPGAAEDQVRGRAGGAAERQHDARGDAARARRERAHRRVLPGDGGDNEELLAEFEAAGVDLAALAKQLQDEGAEKFVKSWTELLERIEEKSKSVAASSE